MTTKWTKMQAAWCCLFGKPLDYSVIVKVKDSHGLVGKGIVAFSIPASCRRTDITSCTYSGFCDNVWIEAAVRRDK